MTRRVLVVLLGVLALAGVLPGIAQAAAWWRIGSEVAPTNLPPQGRGEIVLVASNLGDQPASGANSPIVITAKLPSTLKATSISSPAVNKVEAKCKLETLGEAQQARCTYAGTIYPYGRLAVSIGVKVEEPTGTVTTLPVEVGVESEGVPTASSTQRVTVNGTPTQFGVQAYELGVFNEDGTPGMQAGSHPFQLTTTLTLNQTIQPGGRQPVALPKDLRFNLPPGLVGNPDAAEQCTMPNFSALVLETNLCSPNSVVGVAIVTVYEPISLGVKSLTVPVFNLVPAQGEPARFGMEVLKVPIVIDTQVATGSDYHVIATVKNATQVASLLSSQVTLWGVPGDPRHDSSRGWECVAGGFFQGDIANKPCPTSLGLPQQPFLTMPTSCPANPAVEPTTSTVETDSWAAPGVFASNEYVWSGPLQEPLGLLPESCGQLPFSPSIGVSSQAHAGAVPSGLNVDVGVPQASTVEQNVDGRAEADVRDTTVTLPEGVQADPSAANELAACSEQEIGFEGIDAATGMQRFTPAGRTPGEPSCPEASKVGVVHIRTPLLSHELEGGLYLADPAPNGEEGRNPFGSLIALYLVAEDPVSGVLVKLAGEGRLDPVTGRVSTSFQDTPQLPFEELRVELFGGQRASLSTPPRCGEYASEALFTPWSGTEPVAASSPAGGFDLSEGCSGPGPLALIPSFDAQASNTQAGAFTPFTLEITRPDGEQALTGVTVHLPAGVAALLSTVTACAEPPVGQEWACGPESLIGHSTASSGLGTEPVVLGGNVYLTSGYDGAPFGLLVRTLAQAGPFDLGFVNVRSRINVNPETAAVTITTDPGPHDDALPSMLKGIPVQLKDLQVSVDRPGFEFNPTSCASMRITGTLSGDEGASVGVSSPFQVGGCQSLPFAPTLTATAGGHGSKADGTSFAVNVTSAGLGQANIAKVDLTLPLALSTRLQTLQKACPETVFDANPAGCDEGSVIGHASVHTPVLKSPLAGPAYLVSHGGAAFPDVEFVLQGEGITLVLDGKTDIKNGITYSRFESAPDAPFTSFQTELPAGPHSALTPNVPEKEEFSLCKTSLAIPTRIVAQDGAVIEQDTPITLTGCGEVKASKTTKPTRAQLLAKALKACRNKHKHNKHKRITCEHQAHKHYNPKPAPHKTKKTTSHRD